ncbi:MAG: hypothetical protein EHM93_04255 [Bacteroidales bacterium]|nr:MAG: hypothetical protein EHM93_04255 [Bacteroidales bacterium]
MEQQRKNYQEKAHKSLDDLFAGLESLESKLRDASKDFSSNMEKSIADMKVEGEKLKGKFKEMCDANTNDSWEEIRNGFEKAAVSLREAFTKAWNNFQSK